MERAQETVTTRGRAKPIRTEASKIMRFRRRIWRAILVESSCARRTRVPDPCVRASAACDGRSPRIPRWDTCALQHQHSVKTPIAQKRQCNHSRFLLVCINCTCCFTNSSLEHLTLHPLTVQLYIFASFGRLRRFVNSGRALRPWDLFVRFGTGIGALR